MGGGSWTAKSFVDYSKRKGRSTVKTSFATTDGMTIDTVTLSGDMTNQELFKQVNVHESLKPYKVLRECRDTAEHPNTKPVILALDVTGSMGQTAVEIAKQLSAMMDTLYTTITDIEFLIMGIGDLYCDRGPIQISQFESDIRIAEHLDNVWFEFGGGGNKWESYTAAWYMGSRHCDLDCWKRGEKGTIITIGDERINPTLRKDHLNEFTGDTLQTDVDTPILYDEVCARYNVYHINVDHRGSWDIDGIRSSFEFMGDHYREVKGVNDVPQMIVDLINDSIGNSSCAVTASTGEGISW